METGSALAFIWVQDHRDGQEGFVRNERDMYCSWFRVHRVWLGGRSKYAYNPYKPDANPPKP